VCVICHTEELGLIGVSNIVIIHLVVLHLQFVTIPYTDIEHTVYSVERVGLNKV
jgi:hypothetical protein